MRLEIIVGSNEPSIYPLSLPKITIGSSDSCEIVINSNGLSRKHITIITDNETYYVIDQGSTNGSFMNEERLVPGKKTEFTSFFPIRLGDDVVISLLSDDEARNSILTPLREQVSGEKSRSDITNSGFKRPDLTSSISRKDIRRDATGTHTNLKVPRPGNKSKGPDKKSGSFSLLSQKNVVPFIAACVVGGALYWNSIQEEPVEEGEVPTEQFEIMKARPQVVENKNSIPKEDLLPKEGFTKYQMDMKCLSDVELYFCNLIPNLKVSPFGVVQSKLNLYVMLDGTPYFEEARIIADPTSHQNPALGKTPTTTGGQSATKSEPFGELHYNVGLYLLLLKHLPLLDETKTEDLNIFIALYNKNSSQEPVKVVAFTSKEFNKVKPTLKEEELVQVRSNPQSVFNRFNGSIIIY